MTTDDKFLASFEATTLPRHRWTHTAHVRMAWLYLTRLPEADAIDKIRSGIRNLNARYVEDGKAQAADSHCIPAPEPQAEPAGYHETITVAFVRLIASRVKGKEKYGTFRKNNPDMFDRGMPALLQHYSKDRLHSPESRLAFAEPDLAPLPGE